ncbi:MAG: hypothetical protein LBP59_09375 [Planctomycetaceae bacterium]|nr:hypothetical protein [Planctomycetaceae bacterium]
MQARCPRSCGEYDPLTPAFLFCRRNACDPSDDFLLQKLFSCFLKKLHPYPLLPNS